ncbi:MAG: HlyC/CorC family transporter [Gemmatimonadetes bacterium]|nr:HlyC/CorC family transporter [Gemmatimonadota bacterium]
MDPSGILLDFLLVLVLVGINAYFVAAEFALVAVRRSRIEQLVRAGDARARRVMHALDHPDDFISAAQLGITLASIGIGYLAEGTLHDILLGAVTRLPTAWTAALSASIDPTVLSHAAATVVTLALVTYLHVVLGEQVPKMLSIQQAEPIALMTVGPTQLFGALFRPFIRFMSVSAGGVMRLLGKQATGVHTLAHTPEEIQILVEQSHKEGEIEAGEERMIRGVFEFGDLVAREVMTPRRDLVALPIDASRDEVLAVVTQEAHSRVPIYEGSLDNIVGVLLAKDLIPPLMRGDAAADFDLRALMREPYFIPDTKPVSDLLTELRSRNVHLAIVLDEFGGTEGIVTLEDLLEEIVGDIYDEYDVPEPEDFTETPDGDVLIDGGVAIDEVNARLGLELPEQDFDTIGGLIFGELGRVPAPGDVVPIGGAVFRVEGIEERRVTQVRVLAPTRATARPESAEAPSGGGEA